MRGAQARHALVVSALRRTLLLALLLLLSGCGAASARSAGDGATVSREQARLERQLARSPDDADRRARLARVRLEAGDVDGAASHAARVLRAHPEHVEALGVQLDAAALLADATLWASTWAALGSPADAIPEPDDPFASEAFAAALRASPDGAADMLRLWADAPDADDLVDNLVAHVDRRLFQLYYAADFEQAERLLRLAREATGDRFVWQKHAIAYAFESRARDAASVLAQISDGDADIVHALAAEFDGRGAHRSASGCWQALADAVDGDERASALLAAADAEYALGGRDRGRRLAERALATQGASSELPARLWRVLERRRDAAHAVSLLTAFADALECPSADIAGLRRAEDTLVEASLAVDPSPETAAMLRERVLRRSDSCADAGFARDAGLRMVASFRYADAIPLLQRYAVDRPGDADVVPSLVSALEWSGDGAGAGLAARAFVQARLAEQPEPDDIAARAVLDVLRAGSSDAVAAVRADFLRLVVERAPGNRATTLAWASELEDQGLRDERNALLERFVAANGGSLEARFWVAFWMADNVLDPDASVAQLRALALAPGATTEPAPILHRGAWTVAEAAWLRIFDLASRVSEPDRVVREAILGFAAARGEGDPETWRDVWEGQLIAGWIAPAVRAELLERIVDSGFVRPTVLSALGIARYEAGEHALARDAWAAALLEDPAAIPAILADIERVGALHLALDVLDSSGVDDGSARTARMRFEVRLAMAGEAVDGWERYTRLLALQQATDECLARGCAAEPDDPGELDAVGLPRAALAMRRARIVSGWEPGEQGALAILGNLLDLRAPPSELAPWIERLAHTSDPELARVARDRLAASAYAADAVRLARLELALLSQSDGSDVNALAGTASWFGIHANDGDLLAFVDEVLAGPALILLDPTRAPPDGLVYSGNRRQDAAHLLTLAANVLLSRGFATRALDLAERALGADPDVAGRLALASAALAAAHDTALTLDAAERLVGIAGGGIEDFEEAAAALLAAGHADVAAELLERARVAAPDDLALLSATATALVQAGRPDDAAMLAERLIAGAPSGRFGDEWLHEVRVNVVEPLRSRARHDLAEQLERSALERRPGDLRELTLAGHEVARGAVDAARRRVDRVVARGAAGAEIIAAMYDAGFEQAALDAYERAANRLSLFEHFDLRVPVGMAWARRHGIAAYVELLQNSARGRNERDVRPWLVEELGYNGMTREAASWLAGTTDPLMPDELLMAIAYDLALDEVARAERATERLIALTTPDVPWQALIELWGGRGLADSLVTIVTRSVGTDALPAEVALLELLRGDPAPALARVAEGDADDRLLLARALAATGYRDEALASLGPDVSATATVGRWLLGDRSGGTQAPDLALAGDVGIPLALAATQGVDTALLPVSVYASLVRAGAVPVDAPLPRGAWPLDVARELARVGLFAEAVRVEEAGAAAGLGWRADDRERVGWRHLSGDSAGVLRELALLPDAARRQRAAAELLRGLDLLLDAELAVALGHLLGGAAGDAADAHRMLVALQVLGRTQEAAAMERERLVAADGHPAEYVAMLEAYRTWGQSQPAASLATEAASSPRTSSALWSEIALARAAVGDEAGALEAIDAGLIIAPDPWGYLQGLAEPLFELGAWRAVDLVTRLGLDLEPDGVELAVLRAFAKLRMGEIEAALGDLSAATTRPDVNPYWLVRAVEELVRAGLPGEAERLVRRLDGMVWGTASSMRLLEAPPTWSTTALFEWAALDPEGARAALERTAPAALLLPEFARSETVAARVWEGLGVPDAAADAYHRRLVLAPDQPVMLNNLAYVWAVARLRLDEAEQLALRSLALAPEVAGSTIDTLGWVLYGQGRLADARALVELALRLEASQVPPSRWLAARGELADHLAAIVEAQAEDAAAAAPSLPSDRNERRRSRRRE